MNFKEKLSMLRGQREAIAKQDNKWFDEAIEIMEKAKVEANTNMNDNTSKDISSKTISTGSDFDKNTDTIVVTPKEPACMVCKFCEGSTHASHLGCNLLNRQTFPYDSCDYFKPKEEFKDTIFVKNASVCDHKKESNEWKNVIYFFMIVVGFVLGMCVGGGTRG